MVAKLSRFRGYHKVGNFQLDGHQAPFPESDLLAHGASKNVHDLLLEVRIKRWESSDGQSVNPDSLSCIAELSSELAPIEEDRSLRVSDGRRI